MMVTAYHIKLPVAESNLPKIVSRILELGPEINERDNEGRTPLHFAVLANRYYYAKELIAQKANIMVRADYILCLTDYINVIFSNSTKMFFCIFQRQLQN
jgi:ankyrin repeat protein